MANTKIGYIYILQTENEEFCKIGRARHVMARIRRMSPHLPWKCNLIYWKKVRDAAEAEWLIHWALRDCRANGEWFVVTGRYAIDTAVGLFGTCPTERREARAHIEKHERSLQIAGLA